MKQFKVDGKEFNLCDSWDDISFKQFLEIEKTQNDLLLDEVGVSIRILEILCNAESGDLDEMPIEEFNLVVKNLEFLTSETPEYKLTNHFTIDGIEYTVPDMNTLALGEVASINSLQSESTDLTSLLPKLFAVLVRPSIKVIDEFTSEVTWKRQKLDASTLDARAELFANRLTYVELVSISHFFLNGKLLSQKNTEISTDPLLSQDMM